ncbi:MAG: hypothetical protein ABW199_05655, partial [Caulobacterales bacterium]
MAGEALPKPEGIEAAASGKPPAERVDLTRYSGAEKAAIILMCLGDDAVKLWSLLDEEEIKEISQSMSNLGVVSASVVEALIVEFVQKLSGAGTVMGSVEQTQRLLSAFLPQEKVSTLMEEIRGPAGRN